MASASETTHVAATMLDTENEEQSDPDEHTDSIDGDFDQGGPIVVQNKPVDTSVATIQALSTSMIETSKQKLAIGVQIEHLRSQKRRLKVEYDRLQAAGGALKSQIVAWEFNRPFHFIMQLPVELRNLVWTEYNNRPWQEGADCIQDRHSEAITMVCKQLRKEYLDWLCETRPMQIVFKARGHCSADSFVVDGLDLAWFYKKGWASISDELLARARCVRVLLLIRHLPGVPTSARSREAEWTLNLNSGKVKAKGDPNTPGMLRMIDAVSERVQTALLAIMQRGEIRRSDVALLFMAIAGLSGTHLMRLRERAEVVRAFKLLPFADTDI